MDKKILVSSMFTREVLLQFGKTPAPMPIPMLAFGNQHLQKVYKIRVINRWFPLAVLKVP